MVMSDMLRTSYLIPHTSYRIPDTVNIDNNPA